MAIERKSTTIDLGVAEFLKSLDNPMPKVYSFTLEREPHITTLTVVFRVTPEELERITKGGKGDGTSDV